MSDKKYIKPDVVIELTNGQLEMIKPLLIRQRNALKGMILGSVGVSTDGTTIGLSYIQQELALKIVDLASAELGENDEKQ